MVVVRFKYVEVAMVLSQRGNSWLYITLFYKTTAVKNSNVHIDKRFFQQSVCNYGKIIYIQPFSASKMLFA